MRELAEAASMSIESVVKILHRDLGMRKLTAKWMPCLLTINQKHQEIVIQRVFWTQQSVVKVMVSVFWDSSGILFIDYLKKEKKINKD